MRMSDTRVISTGSETWNTTRIAVTESETYVISTGSETARTQNASPQTSETYVISTDPETDGLVFGLSPGPSRFETARKRASRFIDPAHRWVEHGLHALEFPRSPRYSLVF